MPSMVRHQVLPLLSSRTIGLLTSTTSFSPASLSIRQGHVCTLNYLDCHLCIFNGPVSSVPFMVQCNTTVSTSLYQCMCVYAWLGLTALFFLKSRTLIHMSRKNTVHNLQDSIESSIQNLNVSVISFSKLQNL